MKQSKNILLKRLLSKTKVSHQSELDDIIDFYKTILEFERRKEPDITTYYPYAMHFKDNDDDVMLIDLPCNSDFRTAFLENRNLAYPKDLYVGLSLIGKDSNEELIVFSQTIDYNDLKGYEPDRNLLPIRISNLSLDSRHIEELELLEEKTDEINAQMSQIHNISDLQDLIHEQFGDNVDLKMELQLGLSSQNIALAQTSAELNRLKSSMVEKNQLLKSFLTHFEFDNVIDDLSVEELISVSPLDESQESVVAHALNNRFSVVTGAPGTGKTQVILNIIANALMRDKTVLMASKNNKAVDNVKERFDNIDSSQYLLRFGRKEYVKNQMLPALSKILNRLSVLNNQSETLSVLLSKYREIKSTIESAQKKLSRIDEIKVLIQKLYSEKSVIESQIEEENQRFSFSTTLIKNKYSGVLDLEKIHHDSLNDVISKIKRFRNSLQRKYSGFTKIWHNIFSKKKHSEIFLNYVEDIPSPVKVELREKNLTYSIDDFENGNVIIEHSTQVLSLLERIVCYQHMLEEESRSHKDTISGLSSNLSNVMSRYNNLTTELEDLNAKRNGLIALISRSNDMLLSLGPQLVAAKIMEIERGQNASGKISSYKSFLPDNIPRRDDEMPDFICRSKDFLSICRLISVTSLSIKTGFPLTDNLFDILIIDEASQCDVASAIPLILRAKQVVVIGDPMQLKHITSVKVEEEMAIRGHFGLSSRSYLKYVEQSLWDYAVDFLAHASQNSSSITLENHYRCHHDIIGYSNHQFYSRFLDKPLNVRTDESNMTLRQQGVVMINIHGKQESEHLNVNRIEGDKVIALANEVSSLNAEVSIGIVTPFRDQADYIKSLLDDSVNGNIVVNTAHGFQGDEKDVVIYSLVVTDNTPQSKVYWIDYMVPNLVNVAVTRARQTLYIVGNADYIKDVSPEGNALGYLIRYAESKTK